MRTEERHLSTNGVAAAPTPASRACPFCRAPAPTQFCAACGRDTTAPRRPCRNCRELVPTSERACWSCGARFRSEMLWKIPLIVFLFLLAFAVSVAIAALG
ncbi:MAG: hypothetical protein ACRD68_07585 [Pyrinomonadaceae bacterium]